MPDEDHIALIRAQPWLRCIKPPNATETYDGFYKRRQREKLDLIRELLELAEMSSNDPRQGSVCP